jgi:hypothetical protein
VEGVDTARIDVSAEQFLFVQLGFMPSSIGQLPFDKFSQLENIAWTNAEDLTRVVPFLSSKQPWPNPQLKSGYHSSHARPLTRSANDKWGLVQAMTLERNPKINLDPPLVYSIFFLDTVRINHAMI